ncbi:Replication factor C subunit 5 [Micractinium conductrix]|uniref:Replication factor C subunit 5 n=1 Tax=Micractinium conductrix TaxID=554055 RepID=A0A2P6V1R9_9CHLO|nr:Replication factor C subunit 5 [Micractinium conductrix]|eukprot:PSC68038.1 Replication factor C subunit 5 [Micractinium conductrix]
MATPAGEQPWSEKYRPRTLDEVAAHGDIIDTIKRLLAENQLPHLLFYGPPGTGKTSTILAIARQIYGSSVGNMTLELNASDDRGIAVVRNEIQDFASTRTIFSNKFKLIILDECDAMTKDAQFALRRVMEKYTRNARFCLICNYVNKVIPALQSRCTRFRFQPLPQEFVRARLEHICSAEGLKAGAGGLDALIELGGGDMRRTLNLLQSTHMSAGELSEESAYATAGKPLPADIDQAMQWLLNEPLSEAFCRLSELQAGKGVALVDILQQLHPFVFRIAMPSGVRIELVSKLAAIEHRLAYGTSDRLQLGAMCGAFAEAKEGIVHDARELGEWVHELRAARRRGALPPGQAAALDALGFAWQVDVITAKWYHNLHAARRYREVHGTGEVPADLCDLTGEHPDWVEAGRWLERQKDLYRRQKLLLLRVRLMKEVLGVKLEREHARPRRNLHPVLKQGNKAFRAEQRRRQAAAAGGHEGGAAAQGQAAAAASVQSSRRGPPQLGRGSLALATALLPPPRTVGAASSSSSSSSGSPAGSDSEPDVVSDASSDTGASTGVLTRSALTAGANGAADGDGASESGSAATTSTGLHGQRRLAAVKTTYKLRVGVLEGTTFLNQYIVIDTLGRGSYGKVKLCLNTGDDTLYAVKVVNTKALRSAAKSRHMRMRRAGASTGPWSARPLGSVGGLTGSAPPGGPPSGRSSAELSDLRREVEVMRALSHPNLLRLFEVIQDKEGGKVLMVMEYAEGGAIVGPDTLSPERVLPEAMAQFYFRQMAAGLAYLHEHHVVHGDVKPENVMLCGRGTVKIGDFGQSQFFERGSDTFERTLGTPAYLAPEICAGEAYHGRAADVWALGVSLYHFIFGELPFKGESVLDLYDSVATDEVPYPRDRPISHELQDLFLRLLHKDPRHRCTVAEVLQHPWVSGGAWMALMPDPTASLEASREYADVAVAMQHPLAAFSAEDVAAVVFPQLEGGSPPAHSPRGASRTHLVDALAAAATSSLEGDVAARLAHSSPSRLLHNLSQDSMLLPRLQWQGDGGAGGGVTGLSGSPSSNHVASSMGSAGTEEEGGSGAAGQQQQQRSAARQVAVTAEEGQRLLAPSPFGTPTLGDGCMQQAARFSSCSADGGADVQPLAGLPEGSEEAARGSGTSAQPPAPTEQQQEQQQAMLGGRRGAAQRGKASPGAGSDAQQAEGGELGTSPNGGGSLCRRANSLGALRSIFAGPADFMGAGHAAPAPPSRGGGRPESAAGAAGAAGGGAGAGVQAPLARARSFDGAQQQQRRRPVVFAGVGEIIEGVMGGSPGRPPPRLAPPRPTASQPLVVNIFKPGDRLGSASSTMHQNSCFYIEQGVVEVRYEADVPITLSSVLSAATALFRRTHTQPASPASAGAAAAAVSPSPPPASPAGAVSPGGAPTSPSYAVAAAVAAAQAQQQAQDAGGGAAPRAAPPTSQVGGFPGRSTPGPAAAQHAPNPGQQQAQGQQAQHAQQDAAGLAAEDQADSSVHGSHVFDLGVTSEQARQGSDLIQRSSSLAQTVAQATDRARALLSAASAKDGAASLDHLLVSERGTGEFLGSLAMLDHQMFMGRWKASAVARTHVVALAMSKEGLESFLQQHPLAQVHLRASMARARAEVVKLEALEKIAVARHHAPVVLKARARSHRGPSPARRPPLPAARPSQLLGATRSAPAAELAAAAAELGGAEAAAAAALAGPAAPAAPAATAAAAAAAAVAAVPEAHAPAAEAPPAVAAVSAPAPAPAAAAAAAAAPAEPEAALLPEGEPLHDEAPPEAAAEAEEGAAEAGEEGALSEGTTPEATPPPLSPRVSRGRSGGVDAATLNSATLELFGVVSQLRKTITERALEGDYSAALREAMLAVQTRAASDAAAGRQRRAAPA